MSQHAHSALIPSPQWWAWTEQGQTLLMRGTRKFKLCLVAKQALCTKWSEVWSLSQLKLNKISFLWLDAYTKLNVPFQKPSTATFARARQKWQLGLHFVLSNNTAFLVVRLHSSTPVARQNHFSLITHCSPWETTVK